MPVRRQGSILMEFGPVGSYVVDIWSVHDPFAPWSPKELNVQKNIIEWLMCPIMGISTPALGWVEVSDFGYAGDNLRLAAQHEVTRFMEFL